MLFTGGAAKSGERLVNKPETIDSIHYMAFSKTLGLIVNTVNQPPPPPPISKWGDNLSMPIAELADI